MPNDNKNINFVFFGTSRFAVIFLEELKGLGIIPSLVITTPDKPKGRNLAIASSPIKEWALKENVTFLQPEKLNDPDFINKLKDEDSELFIVASYGKIIPSAVLNIPQNGSLNIHPSLLPKYRGPSPIQSQILNDEKNLGTTIIKMDEKVDHGPIVASKKLERSQLTFPYSYRKLESELAIESAKLLSRVLHSWVNDEIKALPQNEKKVTFTKIIKKVDGLIDLDSDPYKNFLKFLAYEEWPGTYFFAENKGKKIRVIIKNGNYEDNKFNIKRVLPEGKREMDYQSFLNR